MAIPIIVTGDVPQGSSRDLEFQLELRPDTPIAFSNIQSATMSLFLHDRTDAIINNRDNIDVLASFNATGYFSHQLTPEDNQIQSTSRCRESEIHVAVITIVATGSNGDETLVREMFITIVNQQHVPNAMTVNPISMTLSTVNPTVVIA